MGVAFLSFVLVGTAFSTPLERPRQAFPGGLEAPPTLDQLVATCGGIISWENPEQLVAALPWTASDVTSDSRSEEEIQERLPADWMDIVENADSSRIEPRLYRAGDPDVPSVPEVVRYMAEGNPVIWYSPESTEDQIRNLATQATRIGTFDIPYPVLPWNEDSWSGWPSQRTILFTAWASTLSCRVPSDLVMADFWEHTQTLPHPLPKVPARSLAH